MRPITPLIAAAAVVVGVGCGGAAYRIVTSSVTSDVPNAALVAAPDQADTSASVPPAQVQLPGTHFAWAPCRPPAVREGRLCVTSVVRVLTLPATPVVAPAPASPVASPARTAGSRGAPPAAGAGRDDGGGERVEESEVHGDEDEGDDDEGDEEEGDEDHGDEDHGDEDHGDEDHGDEEPESLVPQ